MNFNDSKIEVKSYDRDDLNIPMNKKINLVMY